MLPPTSADVYYTNDTVHVVRWHPQDFPLTLLVDADFGETNLEALQQAVFSWNSSLDSEVFVLAERRVSWTSSEIYAPDSGTIIVLRGDIPDDSPMRIKQGQANLTWNERTGHLANVYVFLDIAVPDRDAMLVLKHELGHALGLRHDDWRGSVMYRDAVGSGGRIMPDDLNFVRWEMTNNQFNVAAPGAAMESNSAGVPSLLARQCVPQGMGFDYSALRYDF